MGKGEWVRDGKGGRRGCREGEGRASWRFGDGGLGGTVI